MIYLGLAQLYKLFYNVYDAVYNVHLIHGHGQLDREQGLGSLTVSRFLLKGHALSTKHVLFRKPRLLCKRGFLLSIFCFIKITTHNI